MQSNKKIGISTIKDQIRTIKIYYEMTLVDSDEHQKIVANIDKELLNKLNGVNTLCKEIIEYIKIRNENK